MCPSLFGRLRGLVRIVRWLEVGSGCMDWLMVMLMVMMWVHVVGKNSDDGGLEILIRIGVPIALVTYGGSEANQQVHGKTLWLPHRATGHIAWGQESPLVSIYDDFVEISLLLDNSNQDSPEDFPGTNHSVENV
ncbi:hypothetical protein Tco_0313108 [Tanacetum coccineum]